jgi:sodium transport system ATP-binding protein
VNATDVAAGSAPAAEAAGAAAGDLLVARELVKRYGDVTAVDGASFAIRRGEIFGLLGPNGAGKTTTLRILAALMLPDAGEARVGGFDVVREPQAARAATGVLSDARGLYTRLTARENIVYYARLRAVPATAAARRIDELAGLLDMGALLDRRVDGFSSGERMKVALARALIHNPQHLILDEPTNGLDVMSTRALRGLLRRLRDAGKCLLFSTHIMQEVEALSDHIVIVAHGRTLAAGTAAELRAAAGGGSLEDAFVRLTSAEAAP